VDLGDAITVRSMTRLLALSILAIFVLFGLAGSNAYAISERRVALVIGNSDYNTPSLSLTNPKNDASDVADVLKALGFEVQFQLNLGKRDMDGTLEKFARLSASADSSLFYYAGHAIQYGGKNYLVPIDATVEDEISIRYNLVSVDDVRSALDRASGVKVMILDACRNNPISDRLNRMSNGGNQSRGLPAVRGLARIDKTQGMVIAYATAADDVALDGNNTRNSPFAAAFIKEMQVPGLEIGTLFRRVARDVNESTGGRQRPETSISLLSDYYLNQSDRKIWESMRETASIDQIRDFLRQYPDSVSVIDAKSRLDALERAQRDREDAEAAARREAYKKELADQAAAVQAELAKLEDARKGAEIIAAQQEAQRRRDEATQLAALEAQRKKDQQDAADRVAEQQREDQQRLARLEEQRQNAAKALAERLEADQRMQAAEKLAALEQERAKAQEEAAKSDAIRQAEQEAARKAEETCKTESDTLQAVVGDETKLKVFYANAVCRDVRLRAQSQLASLQADRERQDRACDSETQQIAVLVKAPAAQSRDGLIKLQKSLTCDKLSQSIVEAIDRANAAVKRELVRTAQGELRRIGCYRGTENGDLNDATKDALKKANVVFKPSESIEINDDLISELKKLSSPVCTPPPTPQPERKPVASRPSRIVSPSERPIQPRTNVQSTPAAPAPSGTGSKGSMISGTGF
jgi:uncharacterized caspase-like protein